MYSVSRGRWPKWWKALRARLTRSSWGHLAYSTWIRLRGDPISVYNFLKVCSTEGDTDLSVCGRTQGNGMKLRQEKSRLDIRKRFLTEGVIGYWNRLSKEGLWHQAYQNPRSIWTMVLVIGLFFSSPEGSRELDSMIMGLFQLEIFYDSLFWSYLFTGLSVNNSQNENQKEFIYYLLFTQKCTAVFESWYNPLTSSGTLNVFFTL